MSALVNMARQGYRLAQRQISRLRGDDPRFFADGFPKDAWGDDGYDAWFRSHRISDQELEKQRFVARQFDYQPTFSIIVPLYKTPLEYLHTMVDSVLGQTYPLFQLVLVNASPEDGQLCSEVNAYRLLDSRISVVSLERNLGITENTNAGLEVSTGDFCSFLDHDDALEPSLLFEYAKALNDNSEIDVLYCDEDLVVFDSKRNGFRYLHPLFKPSFAPELLLCKNYIVHLMTIRRSLIDDMSRPDARYDGAQDYNMVLSCTNRARCVHGVQKILYHWRISDTSTAANPEAKPYSRKAYRLSASNELRRRLPEGKIIASGAINIHNIWMHSNQIKSVSVIIDASRNPDKLEMALECFCQTNSMDSIELIVILDNRSSSFDHLGLVEYKSVHIDKDIAQSARLNAAARAASNDYLIFLDAGCLFLTPEPLEQLVSLCSIKGVGVSAPKLLYRNGRNKSFGIAVTSERIMPLYRGYEDNFPGYQCNLRAFQNVSAVGLQGLCTPRTLFNELGGFDELFDGEMVAVDYCIRVRESSIRMVVTPTVKLEVDEACPDPCFILSGRTDDYSDDECCQFDKKWPGLRSAGDPYLNRNLDQSSCYQQLSRRDAIK